MKLILLLSFSLLILNGCALDPTKQSSLGISPVYDYGNVNAKNYYRGDYNYLRKEGKADALKLERNRIVYDLMGSIDSDFSIYSQKLRAFKYTRDTITTMASIALTGTASALGGGVAQTLALIDTGIKGAHAAVDKGAYEDHAPSIIINTMRAQRAIVAGEIHANLKKDDSEYPLEAALGDLVRYYNEGVLTTALAALSANAAQRAANEEKKVNDIKNDKKNSTNSEESGGTKDLPNSPAISESDSSP